MIYEHIWIRVAAYVHWFVYYSIEQRPNKKWTLASDHRRSDHESRYIKYYRMIRIQIYSQLNTIQSNYSKTDIKIRKLTK